ncbi:metallophosphoesterase family protein [Anaerophaga thermohalophila]|uniref:metallophosphoesterase family protein n=1 Tax=Anaerophaga thermohalophila TaxID=177400 RepID=UPI00035F4246|nr:metallophosphoesterase family protein [Anaerophaga thermohalophila]
MRKIGLLSDTHGYLDPRLFELFNDIDEVWHAGDIGSGNILSDLESFKICRAVFGNIDDWDIRMQIPEHQRFECEGLSVWMTHIGGYPGKYSPKVKHELIKNPPGLFISGHSHILKVMNDKKLGLLHINPGAAGKSGLHHIRTAVRFVIDVGEVKNLEVIELGKR